MKRSLEESFILNPENIDSSVQKLIKHLTELQIESKIILSVRLSVEDILVKFMEKFPEQECQLILTRSWGKWRVYIQTGGQEFNPLVHEESEDFNFATRLCAALNKNGTQIDYNHKQNANIVAIYLPRKSLSPIIQNVIAIGLAWLLSICLLKFASPETAKIAVDSFIEPTFSAFIGLLSGFAVLMIFLSIISSISSMGDLSTLGKYGKKTIGILLSDFVIVMVLFFGICIFTLDIVGVQTGTGSMSAGDIYKRIVDIIPQNLVKPFLDGNTLQITFLAVCIGIILLSVSNKAKTLISVTEQMNVVVMDFVSKLCSLMPLCIFLSMSKIFIEGGFDKIIQMWKFFAIIIGAGFVNSLRVCLQISLKHKISFVKMCRQMFSVGLTGFLTSSSFACFDGLKKLVVEEYKGSVKNFTFGFSMVQVFYKISVVMGFIAEVFVLAEIYGVHYSPAFLAIIFFSILLLSISTPPVPGGSLATWVSVLTLCQVPLEAMGIIIAIAPFEDMILTGFGVTVIAPQLVNVDKQLQAVE